MKAEILKLMKCPYCETDFEVEHIYEEKGGEVIFGLVKCECSEYPILEGILSLKESPMRSYLVKSLKDGKAEKAVALALGTGGEDICRIAHFLGLKPRYGRLLEGIFLTFVSGLTRNKRKINKSSSFYGLTKEPYFKHRFSADSLWSIYPFIPILKTNRQRILDLGCGQGHVSFVISTCVNPEELVCVDHNFRSLYVARKYLVSDADFICSDVNYPLPFKDNIFTSISMLDAFHYVRARALLAGEIERVARPEGLLLLLHLHNSLVDNPAGGNHPLPPSAWVSLFKHFEIKALPERNLVEDFVLKDELDLEKEYSESELDASNAIAVIGTGDRSLFRVFEGVGSDFLKNNSNLIINPIYRIRRETNKILLDRETYSSEFWGEFPVAEKYLPERYVIEGELAKAVTGRTLIIPDEISGENSQSVENLMRKFIIINAPQKYCIIESGQSERS